MNDSLIMTMQYMKLTHYAFVTIRIFQGPGHDSTPTDNIVVPKDKPASSKNGDLKKNTEKKTECCYHHSDVRVYRTSMNITYHY